MTREQIRLVLQRASAEELEKSGSRDGPLMQEGLRRIMNGETTIEELSASLTAVAALKSLLPPRSTAPAKIDIFSEPLTASADETAEAIVAEPALELESSGRRWSAQAIWWN